MLQAQTAEELSATDRKSLQLKIGGMSCSFCSSSIERALGRQKGVEEVHVSLAHEEALIRYRAHETSETEINDTLRALGYTIRDPRKVHDFEEQEAQARKERWDLASAALFAIVLLVAMLGMWFDLWPKQP